MFIQNKYYTNTDFQTRNIPRTKGNRGNLKDHTSKVIIYTAKSSSYKHSLGKHQNNVKKLKLIFVAAQQFRISRQII